MTYTFDPSREAWERSERTCYAEYFLDNKVSDKAALYGSPPTKCVRANLRAYESCRGVFFPPPTGAPDGVTTR